MKKICIYLDQFAISDMMDCEDSEPASLWVDIKTALQGLYDEGKIFCPTSFEHYLETSMKSFERAKEHDAFFRGLSDGFCIKPELFITSQLMSSLVRNYNVTLKTYMMQHSTRPIDDAIIYRNLQDTNNDLSDMVKDNFDMVNTLRDASRNQKINQQTQDTLTESIKKISVNEFVQRLNAVIKQGYGFIRGDKIGNKEIPNWIDLIIHRLLSHHKFIPKESSLLVKELENRGFDNIPTLDIKNTLRAYLAMQGKKENKNSMIDLMRIANGLPKSDIFFTDKQRKYEIQQLKLDLKYDTKVYSGTKTDLEDFLRYLNDL